jgi:hypothetical protein
LRVFKVRNAHEAIPIAHEYLRREGVKRDSRAGDVLVSPDPVTTVYEKPLERVIFWPERDANPFFHFFEGLWMLAGRDDVEYLSRYNSNIAKVASDDGKRFHGSYGTRWRTHFGFDQLKEAIARLKADPKDRRTIIQMWDPRCDFGGSGKDYPCNQSVHAEINHLGELDIKIFCRSNDAVWGTYGSDSVDFSMLQEYLAAGIGVRVGRYWQISSNYHAYVNTIDKIDVRAGRNPYDGGMQPYSMINYSLEKWDAELLYFLQGERSTFTDRFFSCVAVPLAHAWESYKAKDFQRAAWHVNNCWAQDWRRAACEWLERRRLRCQPM